MKSSSIKKSLNPLAASVFIRSVDALGLQKRWEEIEPLIADAYFYINGLLEPHDLLMSVAHGKETAWLIQGAEGQTLGFGTTELLRYPRKLIARVNMLAGHDIHSWFHEAIDFFETWSRDLEVDLLEIWGRPGWKRLLQSHNYHVEQYLFIKDTPHARK